MFDTVAVAKETPMRLDQAMLFVEDLERMAAFYTKVMGFRPIEQTKLDNWVEFETGGAGFALHSIPAHLASPSGESAIASPREREACKLIFSVDDLDRERTRLSALGRIDISAARSWLRRGGRSR